MRRRVPPGPAPGPALASAASGAGEPAKLPVWVSVGARQYVLAGHITTPAGLPALLRSLADDVEQAARS